LRWRYKRCAFRRNRYVGAYALRRLSMYALPRIFRIELTSTKALLIKVTSISWREDSLRASSKYLVAVALLAVLAVVFGFAGMSAPVPQPAMPQQESSGSVTHFVNPPTYDSGWLDVSDKLGQSFALTHNLNTTEAFVDVIGRQNLTGENHKLFFGVTNWVQGWNQTYGGADYDAAYSMVQTSDGGYAILGITKSYGAGNDDFWLVKTDSEGNVQWNKTYGGTDDDRGRSMVQTADGGYALAGYTGSFGAGNADFWLVKVDSSGNHQWNKTYGGPDIDEAYSVIETFDGGYALAGYTHSYGAGAYDFWLVKTDANGNMQWDETYGGTNWDEAYSVVQTSDGGYAIAGYTRSFGAGGTDFWLVKTESTGYMQWNKTFGGVLDDASFSLIQTVDGGYTLAGYTRSDGAGQSDFWLVKTSAELGSSNGLSMTKFTNSTITLYRGSTDPYWNYVRVRIWLIEEPTWMFGDINQDGVVDAQDLLILSQNYGKTFSLLSLTGIITVAGIHTYKKRKQQE